ncbi:MBL fold metallo-hydrolase [Pacificibacter marinus]|uniref:Putative polyketide biosynthesis zinc-dependent hydrolase BaeB n=1 Tax=Pacificibacter marinus TaxID=658057 RepID=A0A1Y5T895_9RHOB|nr:MBL fold metallo-hydrolase [Pacificibacter marinus]SEL00079.1 Glyoxylase, beta-lactamase superfamily II [Pacificibacter marinus]SLN54607.1 putative polyketide biosynthesis zinc-dependent hydrolase BaeB [Pacificibacter marinus]
MQRPDTITQLAADLVRVIAPNPSPMTFWGTNSYILGMGRERVLIDPGPISGPHADALHSVLPDGARVSHILVTHAHKDHSAGARHMAQATGAPIYAFGDALAGRSDTMKALAETFNLGGGEGVDLDFTPDICLGDGETLHTAAGQITALHTPGHMGNHLCFAWQGRLFSGDLIMGWSSSLISPPDGDAETFRSSCQALLARRDGPLYPGHGDALETAHARITSLLDHRAQRETQVLQALSSKNSTLPEITQAVYGDLNPFTFQAAMRNTFAHLIDLQQQYKVSATPSLSETAVFSLVNDKV